MWEMMAHRKKMHLSNLRPCKYIIHEACELDAKSYRFRHEYWDQNLTSIETIGKFKCGLCEHVFYQQKSIYRTLKKKNGCCRHNSKTVLNVVKIYQIMNWKIAELKLIIW